MPTHTYELEIMNDKAPVELTLSGHTHMQMGIEIHGWASNGPLIFTYKRWGGLYLEGKQYLRQPRVWGLGLSWTGGNAS